VFDQGEEKESDHGDTDLGHHRVEGGAQEGFDFEMLFDPFEEQFHFPPAFIQPGDGAGGPAKVVGEEYIDFAILRVHVTDSPEGAGIFLSGEGTDHADDVIGSDPQLPVGLPAFDHLILGI